MPDVTWPGGGRRGAVASRTACRGGPGTPGWLSLAQQSRGLAGSPCRRIAAVVTPSVERRPGLASTVPFHTVLFALYPVVRMYAENRYEVPVGDVLVPLLIVEVVALGGLALLTWLLHDPARAGIVVSAAVVVVLMFGLLIELLEPITPECPGRHDRGRRSPRVGCVRLHQTDRPTAR